MNRKRIVFVVLHHEIMSPGTDVYWPDAIVPHVASSLASAMRYIKEVRIDEYAWWAIEKRSVDGMEQPVRIGWYGRRGGKLKAPPFKKALAAFKKCKSDPKHHLNM